MHKKGTIARACEHCGAAFLAWPHEIEKGWARFCGATCKGAAQRAGTVERYWSYVDTSGECWLWTGNVGHQGHGRFWVNGRNRRAHAFGYELAYGPPPADKPCVLHACDNPPCQRPTHLFPGTKGDNNRDRAAKGRSAKGIRSGHYTKPEKMPKGERHGCAKLTDAVVRQIRAEYVPFTMTRNMLAAKHGVTRSLIDKILAGEIWTHV